MMKNIMLPILMAFLFVGAFVGGSFFGSWLTNHKCCGSDDSGHPGEYTTVHAGSLNGSFVLGTEYLRIDILSYPVLFHGHFALRYNYKTMFGPSWYWFVLNDSFIFGDQQQLALDWQVSLDADPLAPFAPLAQGTHIKTFIYKEGTLTLILLDETKLEFNYNFELNGKEIIYIASNTLLKFTFIEGVLSPELPPAELVRTTITVSSENMAGQFVMCSNYLKLEFDALNMFQSYLYLELFSHRLNLFAEFVSFYEVLSVSLGDDSTYGSFELSVSELITLDITAVVFNDGIVSLLTSAGEVLDSTDYTWQLTGLTAIWFFKDFTTVAGEINITFYTLA